MKRFLCFVILVLVCFSVLIIPVNAAMSEIIEPRYKHVDAVQASLSINKTLGIATCLGRVDAKTVVPVEVYVRLQQNINGTWTTIKVWAQTGTMSVSCTKNYAIPDGSYRVYVTGYVYDVNGNLLESASVIDY